MFFLQNLCKDLHQKIDVVDEERYDIEAKVNKSDKEANGSLRNMQITLFYLSLSLFLLSYLHYFVIDCRLEP